MSWVVTVSAAIMAIAIARREFGNQSSRNRLLPAQSIEHVAAWAQYRRYGRMIGLRDAPIQIVEFADLECPACRAFQTVLDGARKQFGDSVAVTFIHFPLPMHRFARMAAQAAECAANEGKFRQFVSTAYAKQDSFGLKPWSSYAVDAGITDTASFNACTLTRAAVPAVDSGFALARRLQLPGTPTVIVNGWQFGSPPSADDLASTIERLMKGKTPVGS
ncbi:MAG TPA: thioredoxin domain-containing protein [Gemmatimonadaceae bacterium]|nr:thioredoxin domain-containing protein [Gemmatimonadaceae bacterium]